MAFYLRNEDDFEARKKIIYDVSSITHAHIISKVACHFYVEWMISFLKTRDIKYAYEITCNVFSVYYHDDNCIKDKFNRVFSGNVLKAPICEIKSTGYVIDTLEAVIRCIFHTNSYKEAVLTAVNLGEDTDTIGAITGGIAGMIYGNIPKKWKSQIVNKQIILDAVNLMCNIIIC